MGNACGTSVITSWAGWRWLCAQGRLHVVARTGAGALADLLAVRRIGDACAYACMCILLRVYMLYVCSNFAWCKGLPLCAGLQWGRLLTVSVLGDTGLLTPCRTMDGQYL